MLGNIFAEPGAENRRGKPAQIWGEWVYDGDRCALGIRLDTPGWLRWLDLPTTRSFSYPVHDHAHGYIDGFMTVRKEGRQRGTRYWVAYRRCHGRLRKVYLGATTALTKQRLDTLAQTFLVAGNVQAHPTGRTGASD